MSKLLTIVIPAYNSEKTINDALASLDYTYKSYFNVLIVDDGSKSSLKSHIKNWLINYSSVITCVRQRNTGWGGVINFAIKNVKTKFVKVLDSDDTVNISDFGKYIKNLITLSTKKVDAVVTNYFFKNGTTNNKIMRKYNNKNRLIISSLDDKKWIKLLTVHAFTWNTSFLNKKIKPLPLKILFTDNILIFQTVMHSKTIAIMPSNIVLYEYKIGTKDQSMSWANMFKSVAKLKHILYYLLEFSINDFRGKRLQTLVGIVKSMLYLIVLVISNDEQLYFWQKQKQYQMVISHFKSIHYPWAIRLKLSSLYKLMMTNNSYPLIHVINKIAPRIAASGYLKQLKYTFKKSKAKQQAI
ncbi:MAG: glycosyltransferase [Mycoplasmataceae bacterium]|nr:glycosyltransferase [Mycoplasmataceae bacterium]